jgi:DNA-binding transcriptional ArsR family regulator
MDPATQFAALADPIRCRIIEMLQAGPRPVHQLAAAFAVSRPAISRHLRVLKDAGFVREDRQGRENRYSLERQGLCGLSEWLNHRWSPKLPDAKIVPPASQPRPQLELEF